MSQTGACYNFQQVPTRYGLMSKHSEGFCESPENCCCKSPYFYNDGPRCTGNKRKS